MPLFLLTHPLINVIVENRVLLCTKARVVRHGTLFKLPMKINYQNQFHPYRNSGVLYRFPMGS